MKQRVFLFKNQNGLFIALLLCLLLGTTAFTAAGSVQPGYQTAAQEPTPEATAESPVEPVIITISGKISHGSGGSLPAGLPVTLYHYDSMQLTTIDSTQTEADGSYSFAGVDISRLFVLLTTVEYQEVTYASEVFHASTTVNGETIDLPITVYDPAYDLAGLYARQMHIFLDFLNPETLQVVQVYVIANPTDKTVVGDDPADPLLHFELPAGAMNVQFEDALQAQRFIQDGSRLGYLFVLNPGQEMEVLVSYNLAYPATSSWLAGKPKQTIDFLLPLPVQEAQVFLPQSSVQLKSDQLLPQGVQSMGETVFQLYSAANLPQDSRLEMTLSGAPQAGASGNFLRDHWQTMLAVVIGAALIAGAGIIYWRYRREPSETSSEIEDEEDASRSSATDDSTDEADGGDLDRGAITREELLDAILDLEDDYAAGKISRNAFERQQQALKDRLGEDLIE